MDLAGIFHIAKFICFAVSAICLAAAVIAYFKLDIAGILGDITGRTARKQIEEYEARQEGRKPQTGRRNRTAGFFKAEKAGRDRGGSSLGRKSSFLTGSTAETRSVRAPEMKAATASTGAMDTSSRGVESSAPAYSPAGLFGVTAQGTTSYGQAAGAKPDAEAEKSTGDETEILTADAGDRTEILTADTGAAAGTGEETSILSTDEDTVQDAGEETSILIVDADMASGAGEETSILTVGTDMPQEAAGGKEQSA